MIPRLRIGILPTPIEQLPRLGAVLGGPTIFVKRDDLTGVAFGGNKVRKLEYILAEAQSHGANEIITVGDIQSNHCRLTAAISAKLGFKCVLVLSGQKPEIYTGNLLVDRLLGAEIIWSSRANREAVLQNTFKSHWENGKRPYLIPLGGSSPLGVIGYFKAFEEYLKDGVDVDWIILPTSSAGTQAGLVLAAKRAGWRGKILGISIDHSEQELKENISQLANAGSELLGESVRVNINEVLVNSDYLGEGYAVLGEPEKSAIHLFAQTEGLVLGPVYTGRAAAGMVDMIRRGLIKRGERVLFWHTGDSSTIFAESYSALLFHK